MHSTACIDFGSLMIYPGFFGAVNGCVECDSYILFWVVIYWCSIPVIFLI